MAKKGVLDTTQKTVVKVAKIGAEGVKDVATDALGAAASAVAGVVLGRVSDAVGSRQGKAKQAVPGGPKAVSADTTRSKRKPIKKRLATPGGSATKTGAAKKRGAGKSRRAGPANRKKTSPTRKGAARKAGTKKKAARGRGGR
jgi:hypothetical protein